MGGFQYTDGALQFFPTAEGYVYRSGNTYKYMYLYTDHLGNTRLSYTDVDGNGVIESSEIASNTDYYPFGMVHSGQYVDGLAAGYKYTFQGKEYQDESGLNWHDFGSHMYDPALGRWMATDPQNQFASPYLALGNSPVVYVDPDGEFIFAALSVAALLLTDVGYDVQKAVSPVAFHIDLQFGSHTNGIGLDISVGVPQLAPISYRYDVGATYFFNRPGGYESGWQVRNGGEWGFGFGLVQYSGMRYRDFGSNGDLLADQTVHTLQIGTPLVNVSYTNDTRGSFGLPLEDWVPFIPRLSEGGVAQTDRYRTASGRFRFGLLELGFFLHTGQGEGVDWVDTDGDGVVDTRAVVDGNIDDSRRSNGIIYVGLGGLKIGWDSEGIRHTIQNRFAHDGLSAQPQNGERYPWMLRLNRDPRFVFQFGSF